MEFIFSYLLFCLVCLFSTVLQCSCLRLSKMCSVSFLSGYRALISIQSIHLHLNIHIQVYMSTWGCSCDKQLSDHQSGSLKHLWEFYLLGSFSGWCSARLSLPSPSCPTGQLTYYQWSTRPGDAEADKNEHKLSGNVEAHRERRIQTKRYSVKVLQILCYNLVLKLNHPTLVHMHLLTDVLTVRFYILCKAWWKSVQLCG